MIQQTGLLTALLLCLQPSVTAHEFINQVQSEVKQLEPGRRVEREISGGESHSYQISLIAGQFVRFRLDQQGIDAAMVLIAPDGKQLADTNFTDNGEPESVALEVLLAGSYRVTARGIGTTGMRGSYRLEATVQATATAQDRRFLSAQALLLEAQELTKQMPKTAQQVIEKLEQALPVWRELGAQFWVALTLTKIGRAYFSLNQQDKAIASYEQSLTINRESKDRYGEAVLLNYLANAYVSLRQFDKSNELFESSLALYRELKDRRWEGLTLYSMGNGKNSLNQPEKAMAYYEQALTILREVKDRSWEAQTLNSMGAVNQNRGQMDNALTSFESAIAIFREVRDRSREAQTLNNLGIVYSRLGRSEKALEVLAQGLSIFRELKDRAQEGNTLTALGLTHGGMGQTEKAIEYFEQGLAISRDMKDRRRESIALNNLGLAYKFLSQYEKSIAYLEQALPINREIKNRVGEAHTHSYLGINYAALSSFEKAIESHEEALTIFREVKNRLGEGNTLQNLGSVYKLLGRDDKAIEFYDQSLAIFREAKYRVGEGDVLGNLGNSYGRLSRYEDAIRSLEQALAIYREQKYRLGEGTTLMEMGAGYARQNQHEKAMDLYQQALVILREVKERNFEGLALFKMGDSKLKLGLTDEAAAFFNESLNIMRALGDRSSEIEPLTSLARIESARGNFESARKLIEDSLRIAESLRSDLVSTESRTAYLAAVQGSYQFYTDLLMRQHRVEPTKGLDALAVEVSERQRARSLLDLLTEARADVGQGVDPALIERQRLLGRQLNQKAQQLAQASKPEQAAALKQEISQLENDYERAQADINKASPHYAALVQPQPLKLKEIQQQLDADTVLLEYALGEDRSYLWAVTRDSLNSYELPKGDQIKQSASQVLDLMTARSTTNRSESALQRRERITIADAKLPAAARHLSQTLLAPVAAQLGNKRLVIVADGALQYIPFAMLPEPKSLESGVGSRESKRNPDSRLQTRDPRPPLIVKHEIVNLPSASALAIQRSEMSGRQPAPKMLAVIADPIFDRTDVRFTASATETSDRTQTRAIAFNNERTLLHLADEVDDKSNVAIRRWVIPRLPFTRKEADQLLALAPEKSRFRAVDFKASRATVLDPALGQYRYVHFATHGFLDSERPGLSALVLSMVDEQGKTQDGFLRANDIYNLKLPAELVVLSACQTGLGKDIKGEGLVGLTRGFMYAGAARVVVSLWNVNDKATSDLMTNFYEKMLKQGERPAAALRAAQVEMWKQKQWQSPYYWAAFTMQGEWR